MRADNSGSSTMSRDNRLKAVTTLSSLWDGSPIDRARSMAGESLRAYDRREPAPDAATVFGHAVTQ
jgi:hypothetical protein